MEVAIAIVNFALQCLLIVLPVFLAGVFFIFSLKKNYFQFLKIPVDGGLMFRGKRLFGENKTWRGFAVMPLATFLFVLLLHYFFRMFNFETGQMIFDYSLGGSYKALFYGLAYPLGELPNSFIKRQAGIGAGEQAKKYPAQAVFGLLDKADSLLLCGLVLLLVYQIGASYVLGSILLGMLLHFLTDHCMARMGLKEKA